MFEKVHSLYAKERMKWKEEYRKEFKVTFLLFLVTTVITYTLLQILLTEDLADTIMKSIQDVFKAKGMDSTQSNMYVFRDLFINNSKASLYAFLIGLIPLLFIPYTVPVINAIIISIVLVIADIQGKSVIVLFVLGIMPHGITEIFALCLASTLGIILCKKTTSLLIPRAFKAYKEKPFKELVSKLIGTTLLIVLPLILFSACVEAFITPLLLDLIM